MSYSKTTKSEYLDVTEPSEEIKKQLRNQALLNLRSHQKAIRKLTKSTSKEITTTNYCTGEVSVAFVVFYNFLNIESMNFDGYSETLTFTGDGFGLGVGGGVAWFTGAFELSPAELVAAGEIDYTVGMSGAATVVTFTLNGNVIGNLVAGGISVGAGVFGGSGTFSGSVS
jgi:hypothetical protein